MLSADLSSHIDNELAKPEMRSKYCTFFTHMSLRGDVSSFVSNRMSL